MVYSDNDLYRAVAGYDQGSIFHLMEEVKMGKQKKRSPTRAQKELISKSGLRPENWKVWEEDAETLTLISDRGRRRVIRK